MIAAAVRTRWSPLSHARLHTDLHPRSHALRTGIMLLVAALLTACGAKTPTLPKLGPEAAVLAFGDSITFGTGAGENQGYPALLQELIGRKVHSAGVPGEVSAAGLARLPSAIDYYKPQLLILCSGGNDFLRKLGRQQAAENIRAMVRMARENGVR